MTVSPAARAARWTPELRARQAARIQEWRPWDKASGTSTGPKTAEGKARSSRNADKGKAAKELDRREHIAVAKYGLRMVDVFERQDAAEDRAFARAVAKGKRDKAKSGIVEPATDQPESDRVFTPEEEAKMWAKVGAALKASADAGIEAVIAKVRRGRA
jgi:hypothetical protein